MGGEMGGDMGGDMGGEMGGEGRERDESGRGRSQARGRGITTCSASVSSIWCRLSVRISLKESSPTPDASSDHAIGLLVWFHRTSKKALLRSDTRVAGCSNRRVNYV